MATPEGRRPPLRDMERGFEFTRLEEPCVVAAYALAVPVLRRRRRAAASAGCRPAPPGEGDVRARRVAGGTHT